MKYILNPRHFLLFLFISPVVAPAQDTTAFTRKQPQYQTVIAGPQYNRSGFYTTLWGNHYRKEWATPVSLPIIDLQATADGLTPVKLGGGRQSTTLRLTNPKGKEYVLRTIDKRFGAALPDIYKGTFVENLINDQVSIGHPYSALTIPLMADAAGIYHTKPQIVFVPDSKSLGEFSAAIANKPALFEERANDNEADVPHFGFSENVVSTDKMFEKLFEDNDHRVDQLSFVRARLFDMFIGDWGRHEDQWRWASFKEDGKTIYKPIPRDRDQAYTKFDGILLGPVLSIGGLSHLQSFDYTIKDVDKYNFPARNLDRRLTNEVSQLQWVDIARELQQAITDDVIEQSVRQMPQEVFNISGQEIIAKLKSRRDHLQQTAVQYFLFLAKAVDIVGSEDKEKFVVTRHSNGETEVEAFDMDAGGVTDAKPFYSRRFFASETDELRIYGLGGDDVFDFKGEGNSTKIRVIGGSGEDRLQEEGTSAHSIKVYDNKLDGLKADDAKMHITNNTIWNNYHYDAFKYNKKGLVFRPGVNVGVGYHIRKQQWNKEPAGQEHSLIAYYAINRGAITIEYKSIFYQALGKWNLGLNAKAGIPEVVNFFGIGNDTKITNDERLYYRLRSREFSGGISINRLIDSTHFLELHPFYQSVQILTNKDGYIKDGAGLPATDLERKDYAGAAALYAYVNRNSDVMPTKGITFGVSAAYTRNLQEIERSFARYTSSFAFYLPLLKSLTLAVRAGGAAVNGNPEFYQLNTLGPNENLRGYQRQRFYGKTSAYNNNELRFLVNTRNSIFNGKIGLLAFYDQARVWQPNETSDTWHTGYGGGLLIVPFNKLVLNGTYGISKEDQRIHFRIGFLF